MKLYYFLFLFLVLLLIGVGILFNITAVSASKCSGNYTTISIPTENNRIYARLCHAIDFSRPFIKLTTMEDFR